MLNTTERVDHPTHYTWLKKKCGVEVIDIIEHFSFCRGSALKYLLRAGHKSEEGYTSKEKEIEDLEKAIWNIRREIERIQNVQEGLNC